MSKVTVEYHGVTGVGKNVTEAKRNAGEKIREMIAGNYTPEIIAYRDCAALVWREPDGWRYRLINLGDGEGLRHGPQYGTLGHWTGADGKSETMSAARYSLAQCGWSPADGTTMPEILKNADRRAHDEFTSWAQFQVRYALAKARGMTEIDCHDYAGKNPMRPEVWRDEISPGNPYDSAWGKFSPNLKLNILSGQYCIPAGVLTECADLRAAISAGKSQDECEQIIAANF